jgi:hypothetical protein
MVEQSDCQAQVALMVVIHIFRIRHMLIWFVLLVEEGAQE